jgi:hypothetical protein
MVVFMNVVNKLEKPCLCKVCNASTQNIFSGKVLGKYKINYFFCNNCRFLQTEDPYWLSEAYADALNVMDTGVLTRNISVSKVVAVLIYFLFDKHQKFLDYAGGYGILTRFMRDVGFDFYWKDPFAQNLVARKFEYDDTSKIELVTAIECFEHFEKPFDDINTLFSLSSNIFFTTELLSDSVPSPAAWWYYGLDHGQHISFYSLKTLQFIAKKQGLFLYSFGSMHLFTNKKINKHFFNFLIKYAPYLFGYVKRQMKSRTVDDMVCIQQLLIKNRNNVDKKLINKLWKNNVANI